jgi:hypothetical protein
VPNRDAAAASEAALQVGVLRRAAENRRQSIAQKFAPVYRVMRATVR